MEDIQGSGISQRRGTRMRQTQNKYSINFNEMQEYSSEFRKKRNPQQANIATALDKLVFSHQNKKEINEKMIESAQKEVDVFYFTEHSEIECLRQPLKHLSPRFIEVKDLMTRLEKLKKYEKVVDILLSKKTKKHYVSFCKIKHFSHCLFLQRKV